MRLREQPLSNMGSVGCSLTSLSSENYANVAVSAGLPLCLQWVNTGDSCAVRGRAGIPVQVTSAGAYLVSKPLSPTAPGAQNPLCPLLRVMEADASQILGRQEVSVKGRLWQSRPS